MRRSARRRDALLLHCLVFVLAGCTNVRAPDLAGSEWRPEIVDGSEVRAGADVFVRFEGEGKIVGVAGCNNFFGNYVINADRIEVGPLGATRKFCSEAAMALESQLLAALQETQTFTREHTVLTLFDDQGRERVRFRQTDWD